GFSLFRGRAVENTLRLPYGLLRDVFALLFAIHESDTSELAREKLVAGVVGMMPHDTHATEKAHFIGHLLGLDFSSSAFLRGILEDARQIHDRALHYLGQFLHAAAASGPVVVLLEDLHWADVASLDALVDLLPHVSELPMLVVAVARPTLFERYPQWGTAYAAHQRVELSLLSEDASRQLVSEILKRAESVPVALRDMVVRQAEGNPFYLEELIKVLISDRVILTDSTRWSINVSRLDAIRVPPTLTGVLQAHLDSLPSEERVVLQQASVVGRVFWDEAVRALQTGDTMAAHVDDDLAAILRALEARELIFERAHAGSQEMLALVGGKEYAFKHALFRAVTYETVLKRERSLYHARAAAWLEAHSGARVGEVAGLIGEHAERAGEAREAALWYGRAGKQALEAYAPETAIAFFRRALEIAVDQPDLGADSIPWYAGLAKVLWMRARYPEAIQTYSAMCARAEAMADCDAQARAWNGLAGVHERRGDYRAMFESTQHAEALALRAGDVGSEALATAYFGQGLALYRLGDAQGALALGEQLLALSDSLGDNAAYMRALSLKMLGAAYDMLGRFEEATQCQEQALTLARALGDRRNEGAMLNNLGESARLRGDPVAVERLLAALDVAHEIGDRDGEIARLSNLGGARLLQEDYVTAEADLRRVLEMVGNGNWFGLSETYRFLAEACLGQGKLEEALSAARRALDLAREIGYQELLGGGWRVLGACAARLEQEGQRESGASVPDPRSCFAASLGIFIEIGAEAERARTLREWGRYEIIQGDPQKGVSFWEEARAIFETHQMPCELARTAQFT
ncbi:MAG: tetratricopeptide repeat protein, partial [Anaerolineae bacterium]|nr:tetratricopeptide repeat protein [Anaerolineae bacterium]